MSTHIQLEKTLKVSKSGKVRFRRKPLIIVLLVILVLVAIASLLTVFVAIPAQRMYASVQNILATVDNLKTDLSGKDLTNLDSYVSSIDAELAKIDSELSNFEFLKDLSFTKGYYDNLQVVRKISNSSASLLNTTLPELKVLFKSLGYKVDGEFDLEQIGQAADGQEEEDQGEEQDKLRALIKELPQILELYNHKEQEVFAIIDLFNDIDVNYLPPVGLGDIKTSLQEWQKLTLEFPSLSAQIKSTMRRLPDLLGATQPTTFLVVLQNEKELRASGGLLSAYGLFTVDSGELVGDIKVTDMWDLEGYVSWTLGIDIGYRNIYGQNVLMNRGCGSTYLRAQDSGIYPDLFVSMDIFKDYYDIANRYNPSRYPSYDHVVIVNTFLASDLVALIEPLMIPGNEDRPITSENVAKEIFAETSAAPFDPAIRKEFIGEVASATKEKLIELSANDFPSIFQTLISTIQAKNIAFYSKDADMQAYFDELGLSGRIEQNFTGDYFHLNEAQNCSLKANFYVENSVTQNIEIREDGSIAKQVRVDWVNDKIYDPKEKYILSDSINFSYRAWVRVMAPQGTTFTNSDGFLRSNYIGYFPQTYFDTKMQKQVSDNIIWFDHRRLGSWDPVKTHQLNVSYTLPDSIKYTDKDGYRLLVQKHPGKDDEHYKININHEGLITSIDFVLDRDKVVVYKQGVIRVENYDTRLDQYYNLFEQLKSLQS